MIVRGESTIIDYHAPFDQGFTTLESVAKQGLIIAEKQLCTCVINLCTFLCRPLQNANLKRPSSVLSEEREPQRLIFYFGFIDVSRIQCYDSFDRAKQSK